jgi:hypothetical protein
MDKTTPHDMRFTMVQIHDETQHVYGTTIRLRVYVPDLCEEENDLPYLFSIEKNRGVPKWTTVYFWASRGRWIEQARAAFDEAIAEARG